MTDASARRAVEAVWRGEAGRIVAALTRHTGDFAWAEDLAQDALVEAVASWPKTGIPDNPGAWLLSGASTGAEVGGAQYEHAPDGNHYWAWQLIDGTRRTYYSLPQLAMANRLFIVGSV